MKKLFFALLLSTCSLTGFTQPSNIWDCGGDNVLATNQVRYPNYDQLIEQTRSAARHYIDTHANQVQSSSTYLIPVVVHVIYDMNNPVNNVSYAQIQSEIAALNAAYARNYPAYNQQSHNFLATNTQIQFCLARQSATGATPWSSSQPGVIRYGVNTSTTQGQNVYDVQNSAASAQNLYDLTHLPNPGEFPFANYLNIWLVHSIDGGVVMGYGTYPVGNTYPIDGVVMRGDIFGDNTTGGGFSLLSQLDQGKICVHEVGHWLGLYHTFSTTCTNSGTTEAHSINSNSTDPCDINGDGICDTPPTTTSGFNCVGAPAASGNCPNSAAALSSYYFSLNITQDAPALFEDYMSYSDDNCMNTFTPEQALEMQFVLTDPQMRPNVSTFANWALTGIAGPQGCVPAQLIANFTYSPNQPCVTNPVNFTTPGPGPGYAATSWLWDFGDLGTSTAQNPSHTYANAGTYTVTLTAYDNQNNQIQVSQVIFISSCSPISAANLGNANWYFGQYGEVTFLSGSPVQPLAMNPRTFNTIVETEGCVTQNDPATGNLIFYSNGINVWNSFHQQFNLSPLGGNQSNYYNTVTNQIVPSNSASQLLSVPFPGHAHQYYIIIPPAQEDNYSNGLRFALVDMTNPNGSVVNTGNLPLPSGITQVSEMITAVPTCNGVDYWVIAHGIQPDNRFYVYLLSAQGFTDRIMSTAVPDIYPNTGTYSNGLDNGGQLKTSPDGTHLVGCYYGSTSLGVYDFNNSSGIISNERSFTFSPAYFNFCSFSPNSQFIWASTRDFSNYSFVQFDVATGTSHAVIGSLGGAEQMQLGADGRIYTKDTYNSTQYLSSIDQPDVLNNTAFTANSVPLVNPPGGVISIIGLPNMIDAVKPPVTNPSFSVALTSGCDAVLCTVDNCWANYSTTWDFGDNSPIVTFPPGTLTAGHNYATSGTYTISVTFSTPLVTLPVVTQTISIITTPIAISGNTGVCLGNSFPETYGITPTLSTSSNATYVWSVSGNGSISGSSTGSTVQVVWTSGGGTVSVTVTTSTTCTYSASLTVTTFPAVAANAGADASTCIGGSVQLSAAVTGGTSPFAYAWTPTFTLSNSTITNPVASPTTATIYNFAVTDANGCTSSDAVLISIVPSPTVAITPSTTNIIANNQTATLLATAGFSSYSWMPGFLTGVSVNVSPTVTTIYTVTATNANGCTCTSTATVNVVPPCGGCGSSTTLATSYTSGTYTMTGTWCASNNVSISGIGTVVNLNACDLNFTGVAGTQTYIHVSNGAQLNIVNSHLHSCNSDLWDGIYIDDASASVTVSNGSIIEDAFHAIVSRNGGPYTCTNSTFNSDYIGIEVDQYGSPHTGTVRGCSFTSTFGLKAPFTGAKTSVGILIDGVQSITVGYAPGAQNKFDGIECGIRVKYGSKLTAVNNEFKDIVYTMNCGPQPCPYTGVGIYMELNSTLIAGGSNQNANNFHNSSNGIFCSNNVNATITYNVFQHINPPSTTLTSRCCYVETDRGNIINVLYNSLRDFKDGIVLQDYTNCQAVINYNTISDFTVGYGILCRENNKSTLQIRNNSFNPHGNSGQTAILVSNTSMVGNGPTDVQTNTIRSINTGIELLDVFGVQVTNLNDIKYALNQAPLLPEYGIYMAGCNKSFVDNNFIYQGGINPPSFSTPDVTGIYVASCLHSRITNNRCARLVTGFRFAATPNILSASCNQMINNRVGMELNFTDIGTQGSSIQTQDNQWFITSGMKGATNISSTVPMFFVRGNALSTPWFMSNAQQVPTGGALNHTFANPLSLNCLYSPCINCNQQSLAQIAQQQPPYNQPSTSLERYLTVHGAYKMILNDSSIMHMNTTYDPVITAFKDSVDLTNIGSFGSIADLLYINDTVGVTNKVNSITPNNPFEADQKTVAEIYSRTWAKGIYSFSSQDYSTLLSIAIQRYDEKGTAVLDARVMLNYFQDDYQTISSAREMNEDLSFSTNDTLGIMYPNPAIDKITYQITLDENSIGEFELFDMLGQPLQKLQLKSGENILEIDLGEYSSGMYLYRVFIDGEAKTSDILIISK